MASDAARSDPRHRLILAHPERALGGLDLEADAPASNKRAGECRIGEIDRNRIIQHAAHPRGRHGPAGSTAVFIKPSDHSSILLAETFGWNGDADADREVAFG